MKYRISIENERRLEQFVRSNFAQLFADLLKDRELQLHKMLKGASPENFQQVQGQALEIDDLIELLKAKAVGE